MTGSPVHEIGCGPDRIAALQKTADGHKYTHGHALILSGPEGRGGAARLAARGALRIGAGLVTVGCPPRALAEHAARLDAVMLRDVRGGAELAGLLEDRRITALCVGPGLGLDERAEGLVAAALGQASPPAPLRGGEGGAVRPTAPTLDRGLAVDDAPPLSAGRGAGGETGATVLDADALTILSRRPDLFAALHDRCILTPHDGEFARLFPDIAERLSHSAGRDAKIDATREAAARAGCVVLCKGPRTVIAGPDGRCAVTAADDSRAGPWLATAGSGDVLAGFVTGLLARGFAPMDAAETAVWLHLACARSFGPGLIAEDLPEELPRVFRRLLA